MERLESRQRKQIARLERLRLGKSKRLVILERLIALLEARCCLDGVDKGKGLDDIMKFMVTKIYSDYSDWYMNKELIIKNKVDSLNITIPNARVGEEYKCPIIKIKEDDVLEYWLEGLDNTGLVVRNEDGSEQELKTVVGTKATGIIIQGVPNAPGDYEFVLKYKCSGWYEGRNILERKLKLVINPDPRKLWQDIPTDPSIKFFKKDCDTAYICVPANDKGPQKDIVVASKRGRSHAHEGKARDDDFRVCHILENGWYIMAVADGAGSAKYSRKGSAIACETCVEFCKNALQDSEALEDAICDLNLNGAKEDYSNRNISTILYNIVGGAAHKAHRAILEFAAGEKNQPRDYATTLLLAICKKFDFGWFVASFWVGDGAMCIYDKDRRYIKLLGTPDGGEYAGQTRFLTMTEIFSPESIMSRLKYSIEKDFLALLLMTDGVSDPFFETDANLRKIEKWDTLWEKINSEVDLRDDNEESKEQLLKWLDFWSPGNHDDRTIAILY